MTNYDPPEFKPYKISVWQNPKIRIISSLTVLLVIGYIVLHYAIKNNDKTDTGTGPEIPAETQTSEAASYITPEPIDRENMPVNQLKHDILLGYYALPLNIEDATDEQLREALQPYATDRFINLYIKTYRENIKQGYRYRGHYKVRTDTIKSKFINNKTVLYYCLDYSDSSLVLPDGQVTEGTNTAHKATFQRVLGKGYYIDGIVDSTDINCQN